MNFLHSLLHSGKLGEPFYYVSRALLAQRWVDSSMPPENMAAEMQAFFILPVHRADNSVQEITLPHIPPTIVEFPRPRCHPRPKSESQCSPVSHFQTSNPNADDTEIVSDTASQDAATDRSGPTIKTILAEQSSDFSCVEYVIVSDDITRIQKAVKKWTDDGNVDWIITTGGTGLGVRDKTPEVCTRK